jgi:hypothetical protein
MSDMPQVIRWEEPPPAKRYATTGVGHSSYAPLADELRGRPDQWALVMDKPGRDTGLANHIRMGQMLCFSPAGDFDACSRQIDGRTLVYARYLGDPADDWTLR